MKSKRDSSSERIGAMLLGGSLCSEEKYKGPLFARKKQMNWGPVFFILIIMVCSIALWETLRRNAPEFKAGLASAWNSAKKAGAESIEMAPKTTKKNAQPSRGLASDKK